MSPRNEPGINSTRGANRTLAYGTITLLALTGLVLALTGGLLRPTGAELLLLAAFLLLSGGITTLLGLGTARLGWPWPVGSLKARLLLACILPAVLALANVAFTAFLMFLSTHDLALLSGLLAFALGISIFVAFALSISTTRYFRELVDAVTGIGEGNLEARVPVRSSDELGKLAGAFNHMLEQLEAGFARERDLEQARRDLIGSVSHDLRTPLASIRAMVEGINDGVVTDPETRDRYLGAIETEVKNLSRLIDDLFELSRLDAGALELHLETSSIPDMISDTLESMSAQAAARSLNLTGAVQGEVPLVMMDPPRVQRVLYNLVQNAIRHTPPDGSITIVARDAGAEVQVEVSDTGEGIPEQDLPRLFEKFYRSDQSRSRDLGGAGLGLSIARGIVEAHGGRLWVDSAVGRGSTFGFALPKASMSIQAA